MRLVLTLVSVVLLVAGALAAFAPATLAPLLPGLFGRAAPATGLGLGYARGREVPSPRVRLSAGDGPVTVRLDVVTSRPVQAGDPPLDIGVVVDAGARSVLARGVALDPAAAVEDSPQTPGMMLGAEVGAFDPDVDGDYVITVTPAATESAPIETIAVTLVPGSAASAPLVPAGYGALALGAIGLVLASRRRQTGQAAGSTVSAPASPAPTPVPSAPRRWGRGGTG